MTRFYKKTFLLFALFSFLFLMMPAKAGAVEEDPSPVYYVRFSGQGLSVYDEFPLAGNQIAILPDGTYVQILAGPLEYIVKIRVYGTTIEGFADMRYLKRLDDIVQDSDIYTYDELTADIAELQAKYPDLLHVRVTGQSADGRDLYELTLGNPSAPKTVLIHAGIHAREYVNPYLVMEQLEQCLDYYQIGTFHGVSYQALFDNVAVHIVPMVNPDGISISQSGESALRSPELVQTVRDCYARDAAARRTRSSYEKYLTVWKANARGVDINRNFDLGFGAIAKVSLPSYAGYPGVMPFSEPETLSLVAVTLQCSPSVTINYHSMGEVAYWDTAETKYRAINTEFSNYMLSLVPYFKMPQDTAYGSYLDYIYSLDHPVCSITFETGKGTCPFGFEQYPKIWRDHFLVMLTAAEYAYIH